MNDLFRVELIAKLSVTASSLNEATGYAKDDATEFSSQWNYTVGQIAKAADDIPLTEHIGDQRPALTCTSSAGRGEREFSFDATFEVFVRARYSYAAGVAALDLAHADDMTNLQADLLDFQQSFYSGAVEHSDEAISPSPN